MKMEFGHRALDKIYRRRDRYEIPEWQRDEVWTLPKKQLLIDTILHGWKLPKFYFNRTSEVPEEFEVVDGQQRLATIFEFFDGDLKLSSDTAKQFGGDSYETLPDDVVDSFDDYEVEYDTITAATDSELKAFFQRLQEGLPLTSSEKLNSVHSNLTTFCRKLAKHSIFAGDIGLKDTRKAHFDVVSKVAAIEIEGLDVGLRYEELKKVFEGNTTFSHSSNVAKRLESALGLLDRVFSHDKPHLRNRSTIQSFATLAAALVEAGHAQGLESRLRPFLLSFMAELSKQVELGSDATDADYVQFQRTLSANVKTGARTRHEVLLRKLFLFDPSFADALGPTHVARSGLHETIARAGESVTTLVERVNAHYSAKEGEDLFEITPRTSKTLRVLGDPISGYDDYSTFIDDLYFLVHEGTGQRLDGTKPQSFVDIRDLRTGLRHDLDHTSKGSVEAKKKAIGAVFARYSGGASSPETLSPERFALVQAALLTAIESDLRSLLPTHDS
jgi:hypothetical protein